LQKWSFVHFTILTVAPECLSAASPGRLFDYLAVVEIGIGAPLRKRQVSQGWTPMRVLNRFPHDSWSDFRYEEIDWCALAQFIPHPEPGQSVFHHYRQNRRSRSASAASHAAGQRAGHAKSPSDPSLPTAQPVHDVVAAGDATGPATPGSRRHALLRANAEAAVAQTRKDADKASIIADMLVRHAIRRNTTWPPPQHHFFFCICKFGSVGRRDRATNVSLSTIKHGLAGGQGVPRQPAA